MITKEFVRAALDKALREADTDCLAAGEEDHPWRGGYDPDEVRVLDCAAHNESLSCCLDPSHPAYTKMLDYLAERVARFVS